MSGRRAICIVLESEWFQRDVEEASGESLMPTTDTTSLGLGKLLGSWWALTGYILRACVARVSRLVNIASDKVKDTILDMDLEKSESASGPRQGPQSLPPLDPEQFVAVLRPQMEDLLRKAAEIINEDSLGCLTAMTEERVAALLQELERLVVEQAFLPRVAAAEMTIPAERAQYRDWARKYRRMLEETPSEAGQRDQIA